MHAARPRQRSRVAEDFQAAAPDQDLLPITPVLPDEMRNGKDPLGGWGMQRVLLDISGNTGPGALQHIDAVPIAEVDGDILSTHRDPNRISLRLEIVHDILILE